VTIKRILQVKTICRSKGDKLFNFEGVGGELMAKVCLNLSLAR
jgi:hypothetical protein